MSRPRPARGPRPPKPVTPASLEASALWHLARRSLTIAQLRTILARKVARAPEVRAGADVFAARSDAGSALVEHVIEKMTRLGFLDDARVAQGRARALRGRGESKRKIAQRLRTHGVSVEHIDGALADESADSELQAARTYARRRSLAAKDPHKALAALARQGFSYDVAKRALAAPSDEA